MSTVLRRRRRTRGLASSSDYRRARREAAELHQKAANQNKHVGRSWAKAVVDNHQLIAVEDFEPELLSKTTMARKSADAAVGAAKRDLTERGTRATERWCWCRPIIGR
jgi:putative transposase